MPLPLVAAAAGGASASGGFSVASAAGGAATGTSTSVGLTVKLSAETGKFAKAMGDVGKDAGKASKAATEGFSKFEGVLGKLPGILATVTGALLAFFGPSELFRTMIGTFIEIWGVWIDVLLTAFLPVWEVFVDEMVELIPVIEEIAEQFAPVIADLARKFTELFNEFRPEIEALVAAFFALVATGIDIFLEIIFNLLEAGLSIIRIALPMIEEMFTPENIAKWAAQFSDVVNNMPSLADSLKDVAIAVNDMVDMMPQMISSLKEMSALLAVIVGYVNTISGAWDKIGGIGRLTPVSPGMGGGMDLGAILSGIGSIFLGSFQHGGVAPRTGLALVHAGEPIGESAGGVVINFHEGAIVLGRNVRREDAEDLIRYIREELRRTGNTSINTLR